MNTKKFLTLFLALALTLSLAACGSKSDDKTDSGDQAMTAEELDAKIQDLAKQENAVIEGNIDLWQKLFTAMDAVRDQIAQETNYGAYLLSGIELVKDQFTESRSSPRVRRRSAISRMRSSRCRSSMPHSSPRIAARTAQTASPSPPSRAQTLTETPWTAASSPRTP